MSLLWRALALVPVVRLTQAAESSSTGVGSYILAGLDTTPTNSLNASSTVSKSRNSSDSSTSTFTEVITVTETSASSNASSNKPPPTTTPLNSSIASTGSGLAYASQCNALYADWQNSSLAVTTASYTTIKTYTYTNWTASISTLCDGIPRVIGTLTPTATGTNSSLTTATITPTFPAPPDCSIKPSDCSALFSAYNYTYTSYESALAAAATNITLASDFSALTVGTKTTKLTYTGDDRPVITLNSSTYSAVYTTGEAGGSTFTKTFYSVPISGTFSDELDPGYRVIQTGYVPGIDFNEPICNSITNSAQQCGPCTVYGGSVDVLYFPTTASRDLCAKSPATPHVTTCPLGPTTALYQPATTGINGHCIDAFAPCPYAENNATTTDSGPYVVSNGHTYYRNRVYVSIDSAYAVNNCGHFGKTHMGSVVTLATSQVYSVPYNYTDCAEVGAPYDFANLNAPIPYSAFAEQYDMGCPTAPDFDKNEDGSDFLNGVNDPLVWCSTLYDKAYHPNIVVPTQIRDLDPAWATCEPQLGGIYDPPQALTEALSEAVPTLPGVNPSPTTTAEPASSPPPSQPAPTASLSDGITTPRPESTAAASSGPSTEPSTPTAEPDNLSTQQPASSPEASSSEASSEPSKTEDQPTAPSQNSPSPANPSPSENEPASTDPGGIIASLLGTTANASPVADPSPTQASNASPESTAGNNPEPSPSPANSPGPSQGSQSPANNDPSAQSPAQTPQASAIVVADSTFAVGSSANEVTVGSQVLTAGGPAQTLGNGHEVSMGSSGIIVDGTQPAQQVAASQAVAPNESGQSAPASGVVIAGSTFALGSSANEVTIGSQVLTAGGPAQTLNGEEVSAGSNGVIVGGSSTAEQVAVSNPAASTGASAFTFTANGEAHTAVSVSGATGGYVIDGSQTVQMGSSATSINGVQISAASSGLVIDGSQTVAAPSGAGSSPAATISLVSGSSGMAVIDGSTMSLPEGATTINGVALSRVSDRVVVDGSMTLTGGAALTEAGSSNSSASMASGSTTSAASSGSASRAQGSSSATSTLPGSSAASTEKRPLLSTLALVAFAVGFVALV